MQKNGQIDKGRHRASRDRPARAGPKNGVELLSEV